MKTTRTTGPVKPCRINCAIDEATDAEITYFVVQHSVNKSALVRRGLRLALDELKAQHQPKKSRKA